MKELKWKHKRNNISKRNNIERWLDRHNHLMEFIRTLIGITTIILQLYIIHKLTSG